MMECIISGVSHRLYVNNLHCTPRVLIRNLPPVMARINVTIGLNKAFGIVFNLFPLCIYASFPLVFYEARFVERLRYRLLPVLVKLYLPNTDRLRHQCVKYTCVHYTTRIRLFTSPVLTRAKSTSRISSGIMPADILTSSSSS